MITIRLELSGEEKTVLETTTDIEVQVLRKINRLIWRKRLFGKKSSLKLDSIEITQFPNN